MIGDPRCRISGRGARQCQGFVVATFFSDDARAIKQGFDDRSKGHGLFVTKGRSTPESIFRLC
ncbi:hypothetical protein CKO51_31640 [Rhodopirellula sp. SM50]|nr:hypothetical protein CKO51_31640 [Rhodopirellula sp. SM50]